MVCSVQTPCMLNLTTWNHTLIRERKKEKKRLPLPTRYNAIHCSCYTGLLTEYFFFSLTYSGTITLSFDLLVYSKTATGTRKQ